MKYKLKEKAITSVPTMDKEILSSKRFWTCGSRRHPLGTSRSWLTACLGSWCFCWSTRGRWLSLEHLQSCTFYVNLSNISFEFCNIFLVTSFMQKGFFCSRDILLYKCLSILGIHDLHDLYIITLMAMNIFMLNVKLLYLLLSNGRNCTGFLQYLWGQTRFRKKF